MSASINVTVWETADPLRFQIALNGQRLAGNHTRDAIQLWCRGLGMPDTAVRRIMTRTDEMVCEHLWVMEPAS